MAGDRVISDARRRFASSTGLVVRGLPSFVGALLGGLGCVVMVGRCWGLKLELILEIRHSFIYFSIPVLKVKCQDVSVP